MSRYQLCGQQSCSLDVRLPISSVCDVSRRRLKRDTDSKVLPWGVCSRCSVNRKAQRRSSQTVLIPTQRLRGCLSGTCVNYSVAADLETTEYVLPFVSCRRSSCRKQKHAPPYHQPSRLSGFRNASTAGEAAPSKYVWGAERTEIRGVARPRTMNASV